MRRWGWLLLLGLLAACTTPPSGPSPIPTLHLPPAAYGVNLSLNQRLSFSRLDDGTTQPPLEALLELDAHHLQLAGMGMGQRLLTLHWDGQQLHSQRHPRLPATVQAEDVLQDVQWVYGPGPALQAALPTGWQLDEQNNVRELRHGGTLWLRVRYQSRDHWQGVAELEQLRRGYRLRIESRAVEPSPEEATAPANTTEAAP